MKNLVIIQYPQIVVATYNSLHSLRNKIQKLNFISLSSLAQFEINKSSGENIVAPARTLTIL